MPGEKKEETQETEVKLDAANQEVLDYVAGEEAEADRILAEALGKEPEKKEEPAKMTVEDPATGLPQKKEEEVVAPAKVEEKPPVKKEEEDPTKDLTVENAAARIKATRTKMMESNKTANDAQALSEKLEKENAELRALVDKKATGVEEVAGLEKKEDPPEPTELDKSLENLQKEYPELAEPLVQILNQNQAENKLLRDKLDSLETKEVERADLSAKEVEDRHYNSIEEAHPDFEEISQEPLLDQWIEGLTPVEKAGATMIRKQGSSVEVVDLLTKFKKANGYPAPTTKKVNSKLAKAKQLATPSFGKTKEVNITTEEVEFTQEEIHSWSEKEWAEKEHLVDAALTKRSVT
jgi:hypothetical protein